MKALLALVIACGSSPPPQHTIGHFEPAPPPKPSWCADVLANRLVLAGPPIRVQLEARPFDRDAVLAWLREQPCASRRIVTSSELDGVTESVGAIVEVALADGRTLRCVADLRRDEHQLPTFAFRCAPKPPR